MLLTIVTINYNDFSGLSRTIESVRHSLIDFNQVEYIVVDGGSSDSSKNVITSNTDIISSWVSEKDNGIYDAMNKGVLMSNGEYVLFLNSGDALCDTIPIKPILEILEDKKCDIIYGKHLTKNHDTITQSKPNKLNKIKYGMVFNHQASIVKKTLLLDNPFNCGFLSADYDLFLKLYYQGKSFLFFNENICVFDANGVSSRNKIRIYVEWAKISLSYGFSLRKLIIFGLMITSCYLKKARNVFH